MYLTLADEVLQVATHARDNGDVIDPAQPLSICDSGDQAILWYVFSKTENPRARDSANLHRQGGFAYGRGPITATTLANMAISCFLQQAGLEPAGRQEI